MVGDSLLFGCSGRKTLQPHHTPSEPRAGACRSPPPPRPLTTVRPPCTPLGRPLSPPVLRNVLAWRGCTGRRRRFGICHRPGSSAEREQEGGGSRRTQERKRHLLPGDAIRYDSLGSSSHLIVSSFCCLLTRETVAFYCYLNSFECFDAANLPFSWVLNHARSEKALVNPTVHSLLLETKHI